MLDKTGLKAAILAIFNDMATRVDHPETAREDFATALSNAIDTFVKSGDGKYQAGTLTAGATAVTAVGTSATIKIT